MKIFKSYGFWTALSGAVVMLINAVGRCFGFSVEESLVSDIIMAIAGVLVVFGVVTMPKTNDDDTDDGQIELEEQIEEEPVDFSDTQDEPVDEKDESNAQDE